MRPETSSLALLRTERSTGNSSGQSSVFFDPMTKYIWDLALDKDGTLYVATGDTGKIFVVAPDGKGTGFYSSEENPYSFAGA